MTQDDWKRIEESMTKDEALQRQEVEEVLRIRKIRHHLTEVVGRGMHSVPIDMCAKPGDRETLGSRVVNSGAVVHQLLTYARRLGLSGEDTMTLLAYEALKSQEKYQEQLFELLCMAPNPGVLLNPKEPG